jgi:anti-anti-sigma factor
MNVALDVQDRNDYCCIAVNGKFAGSSLNTVRTAVDTALEKGYRHIAFDMEKTKFLDSSAIGYMINIHKMLQKKNGMVHLIAVPPLIYHTLSACNVLGLFSQHKDVNDADETIGIPLSSEDRGTYYMIALHGEFRMTILKKIREMVEEALAAGHSTLALELSGVSYIDSVGIRLIVNLQKKLKAQGGALYLIAVSPQADDVLKSTNIYQLVESFDSTETADQEIG